MNLQAKCAWAATAVFMLFLTFGCEKEDLTIGFPPEQPILQSKYYEFQPDSYVIWWDSIFTFQASYMMVGTYDDPNMGKVVSTPYFEMDAPSTIPTFATDDEYDSAVMTLYYDKTYGSPFSTTQTWSFYLLDSAYDKTESENPYTFLQLPIDSLVTVQEVSINTAIESGKKDSVVFRFPDAFASVLYDSMKQYGSKLAGFDIKRIMPGFHIVADESQKGIVGIISPNEQIKLDVYYSDTDDTEPKVLKFTNFATSHNYIEANKNAFDRSGSFLDGLSAFRQRFDSPNDRVYFQANTGVRMVFDFSELETFKADSLTDLNISNALLDLGGFIPTPFFPAPEFFELYILDENHKFVRNKNNIVRRVYSGLASDSTSAARISNANPGQGIRLIYNSEGNSYQADLSLYIQSIIEGDMDHPRFMLVFTGERNGMTQLSLQRSDIKLRIFYSTRRSID